MAVLSIASLFGVASLTGVGAAPAPVQPSVIPEPLAAALVVKDKDSYKDQDIASLTLLVGQLDMGDSSWKPNESQFVVGMGFDSYRPDNFLGIEAGFQYSEDTSQGGLGQSTEMSLGARKTFNIGQTGLHPYVGAGAAYIWAVNGSASGSLILGEQDSSIGGYAHAGIYWTISRVNIGVDIRGLFGTCLNVAGASDADYIQYAATVGYGF